MYFSKPGTSCLASEVTAYSLCAVLVEVRVQEGDRVPLLLLLLVAEVAVAALLGPDISWEVALPLRYVHRHLFVFQYWQILEINEGLTNE